MTAGAVIIIVVFSHLVLISCLKMCFPFSLQVGMVGYQPCGQWILNAVMKKGLLLVNVSRVCYHLAFYL